MITLRLAKLGVAVCLMPFGMGQTQTHATHSAVPPPVMSRSSTLDAVIIASVHACTSRLEFVHVFERPLSGRVRSARIALTDSPDDAAVTGVHKLFPTMRARRAASEDRRMAAAVPARGRPLLLLLTPAGEMLMALETPISVGGMDSLVRWLAMPAHP